MVGTEKKMFKLESSLEQNIAALITEGQYIPGDSGIFEDGRDIPWLDMELAQTGQSFFAKNYTALTFAHGIYFGLGFGFKPITSTIIRTRAFHGAENSTKRLLSTLWHVLRWYECDIIGCYAEGYKAIARVRKTHTTLRKKYADNVQKGKDMYLDEQEDASPDDILVALRKDLAFLDTLAFKSLDLIYNSPEPMSQLSLAITQLSFVLPVYANPEAFGLTDLEGAEGFEHLWAVIGHLSGLEDRFNIPLQRPGKSEYVRLWKEYFVPSLLVRDPNIIAIQEGFYSSTNTYALMPTLGAASSTYFLLKQCDAIKEDYTGTELYAIIPWRERFGLWIMRLIMWLLTVSVLFRTFANGVTRGMIEKVLENYHQEQLAKGSELTTLPKNTNWTEKYKKHSMWVLLKWRKAGAIIDLMSTKQMRWRNKMLQKKQKKSI